MTPVPVSSPASAAAAAISFQAYLPLLATLTGLLGVAITLIVTGKRLREDRARDDRKRTEDNDHADRRRLEDYQRAQIDRASALAAALAATRLQFLGAARVARNRLTILYQTGGRPTEGYSTFERLLSMCYSSSTAELVAARAIAEPFYDEVGRLEQAIGSTRYSLQRIAEIAPPGSSYRADTYQRVEEFRDGAIAAAQEAAAILDRIRLLLSDDSTIADVKFPISELAPSVRLARLRDQGDSERPDRL